MGVASVRADQLHNLIRHSTTCSQNNTVNSTMISHKSRAEYRNFHFKHTKSELLANFNNKFTA